MSKVQSRFTVAGETRQIEPRRRSALHRRLARIFIAGMLVLHLLIFINLWQRIGRGYPDFTVFYTAGTILRQGLGHRLYDPHVQYEVQKAFAWIPSRRGPLPYIHPPFEALMFLPLTYLPYQAAFVVWDLVNVAMLFGTFFVWRRTVPTVSFISPWEFVAGCLAFFPIFACLVQGQDSILQLLLCVLGFNALKKRSDGWAGCWFGLAMFKFQFIAPLLLLTGAWKRKRTSIAFVLVSSLLLLLSAGLVGWESMFHYPAFVLHVTNSPGFGGSPAQFAPNLRGLAQGWPLHLGKSLAGAIVLSISVMLVGFAAMRLRQAKNLELEFSLAVVLSVLIAWQTNMHDLSLLVLPLVLVTGYCLHIRTQEQGKRYALLFPILPLLISPLWIVLWLACGQVSVMAIPLLWWVWEIGTELSRAGKLSRLVQS